jgi:hypothetical protein
MKDPMKLRFVTPTVAFLLATGCGSAIDDSDSNRDDH